jgi:plastocyanin
MRTVKVLGLIAGLIGLGLTACGGDDEGDSTTPPTEAPAGSASGDAGASIEISGFAFPSETDVAAGASISITNDDGATHTVTADDGAFDIEAPAGETVELVAPAAGSYPYHCNIHSSMTGVLVVG